MNLRGGVRFHPLSFVFRALYRALPFEPVGMSKDTFLSEIVLRYSRHCLLAMLFWLKPLQFEPFVATTLETMQIALYEKR